MKALACVSVCSISIAGNTYKICQDTEVLITMMLQYFDADVSKSGPLEKKKPYHLKSYHSALQRGLCNTDMT